MTFAFDEIQLTEVPAGTIARLFFKDTLRRFFFLFVEYGQYWFKITPN